MLVWFPTSICTIRRSSPYGHVKFCIRVVISLQKSTVLLKWIYTIVKRLHFVQQGDWEVWGEKSSQLKAVLINFWPLGGGRTPKQFGRHIVLTYCRFIKVNVANILANYYLHIQQIKSKIIIQCVSGLLFNTVQLLSGLKQATERTVGQTVSWKQTELMRVALMNHSSFAGIKKLKSPVELCRVRWYLS